MAFEPGGMADKLGNRYEGRWVAKQLLRLLNEEIKSVTVETIGPDEYGVDLIVIMNDGTRQLQQCKARNKGSESWSVTDLKNRGILGHLQEHLSRKPNQKFALVSPIPARAIADICDSARISNDNPKDFFQYQIQEVGKARRSTFEQFCRGMNLNASEDDDLEKAFNYLKGTEIYLVPDDRNFWSDLQTLAEYLLIGVPKTAISVLLIYAENEDKYRKPIYADELRKYLSIEHDIHPKQRAHDERIAPAIEVLQKQFKESIKPGLIAKIIIPREETTRIIDSIDNGRSVVVHGIAGYGKSGVLYELSEYLRRQDIPFLPIRLDRRIPENNAGQFGEDIGLPDSPVLSLVALANERKCVLILDQLDAIRWTSSHSKSAMDVCKEMIRQARFQKNIAVIIASRTFDLEHDPGIKNLLVGDEIQKFVKIEVGKLSEKQMEKIVGKDFLYLSENQKRLLSIPYNLSIWMELRESGMKPDFRSSTQLMRSFWSNRRETLESVANISPSQMDTLLEPLLNYMEEKGQISAPESIGVKYRSILNAFTSFGILQRSQGKITFSHQKYLDHLIAERLLNRIYQSSEKYPVHTWLGQKENQSLFRREQLRQVLATLAEESPEDFFKTSKDLLDSKSIRFHLKHLVLELIGLMDEIDESIGEYCIGLLKDDYWRDHILEAVLFGHSSWISYLQKEKIIERWLNSGKEKEVNRALWLLRSAANDIPDQVTENLHDFLEKHEDKSEQILSCLCWNAADDSEKMFELRLNLARKGYVRDYVDWKSLCAKYPLRAICLIEAVLSSWNINDENSARNGRGRMERWYDNDLIALTDAVKENSLQAFGLFIKQIKRLTSFSNKYDQNLWKWYDYHRLHGETDIASAVVKLTIHAGRTIAAEQPDVLIKQISDLGEYVSPVVQEIIIESFACLPPSHAEIGLEWLLEEPTRFHCGYGHSEPEWLPAERLVKALSPHCSKQLFQKLEKSITHYHYPDEKADARNCLEYRRQGFYDHYWGQTQYFLLPALDEERVEPITRSLIHVLQRKFAKYPKNRFLKIGRGTGGMIGSKLDPNLDRISDRSWLRIVSSEKVDKRNFQKGIQLNSDTFLKTSVRQFASSLSKIAKRFPEHFGQLALQFSNDVDPRYISAIFDSLGNKPDSDLPEKEHNNWQPATIKTVEAILNKFQKSGVEETAISFCRLIEKRSDEEWSDNTIARLVHYAQKHPDLVNGKLNIHCDKSSDEATIDMLFQNTLNCVRGVAARAIGQLLWESKDRLEKVRPAIESLIQDPHPVVRMAAIEAIMPVLNIDKDLAVSWFCDLCKDDLRVAACQSARRFFNSISKSYFEHVGPIIREMASSPLDEVAQEGAAEVTARWMFHGFFEKEYLECSKGTAPQRKGVISIAKQLLRKQEYSSECLKILHQYFGDPDKEVRAELSHLFGDTELISDPDNELYFKEFIKSQAFAENAGNLVWELGNHSGSLIPLAEAIFTVCEEFSTTLKEKTRDSNSRIAFQISELPSLLLRLYEQAQDEKNIQITNRCLDIWDLLFENRVGDAINKSKEIDQ